MINWSEANDSELVCYCIEVNKKTIVDAIKNGNDTLSKIKESTKACTGSSCKELNPSGECCSKDIKNLIKLCSGKENNESCSCCCSS
jgi:NAD(P)H-nitrite reductase large subunit